MSNLDWLIKEIEEKQGPDGIIPVEKIYCGSSSIDKKMINSAYDLALRLHQGQYREQINPLTEDPYPFAMHTSQVGFILALRGNSPITRCAGLLHDVKEKNGYHLEDIDFEINTINPIINQTVDACTDSSMSTNFWSKWPLGPLNPENSLKTIKLIGKLLFDEEFYLNGLNTTGAFAIRLADRLHNGLSLNKVKDPFSRARITTETNFFHMPYAKLIDTQLAYWLEECFGAFELNPELGIPYQINSSSEKMEVILSTYSELRQQITPEIEKFMDYANYFFDLRISGLIDKMKKKMFNRYYVDLPHISCSKIPSFTEKITDLVTNLNLEVSRRIIIDQYFDYPENTPCRESVTFSYGTQQIEKQQLTNALSSFAKVLAIGDYHAKSGEICSHIKLATSRMPGDAIMDLSRTLDIGEPLFIYDKTFSETEKGYRIIFDVWKPIPPVFILYNDIPLKPFLVVDYVYLNRN